MENQPNTKEKIQKLNAKLILWTVLFFGLMIQGIQNWNWFFSLSNFWIFAFITSCFVIGLGGFLLYKKRINKIQNSCNHKYDNSYHCEICGIYWDLRSCIYCNSKKIVYMKKSQNLGTILRKFNVVQCNNCGKSINIDSFSTTKIKGAKEA